MKEVKMPSGAVLKITPSPFSAAKGLYQAVLREARTVAVKTDTQLAGLYKDLLCVGFSSPEIERALGECLKRCTLNAGSGDLKIDENTFEPVELRGDYPVVCLEVARENILPFMKSLYAELQRLLTETPSDLK